MYWINGLYVNTVSGVNYFQAANPAGGVPNGTELTMAWHNDVQGENLNWLFSTGVVPAVNTPTQVLQSAKRIFGGNVTSVTASETLTADNAGMVTVNASSGNITITMPAVAAAGGSPMPFKILRTDNSANTVTIQAAGSDEFQPGAVESFSLGALNSVGFCGDGVSNWNRQARDLWDSIQGAAPNNSGTGTSISTSISFTAPHDCIIFIAGQGSWTNNSGGGGGTPTLSGAGFTERYLVSQSTNSPSVSCIMSCSGIVTAVAGAAVTLTLGLSAAGNNGAIGVNFTYLLVPNT